MTRVEIIPLRCRDVITENTNIIDALAQALSDSDINFEDNDILVVTSKVIALTEGRVVNLNKVKYGSKAKKLAKKARIPADFAQIILEERNHVIIGVVPGAITTINKYGLLANAGADQSNAGENKVILLPSNAKNSAKRLHEEIKNKFGKYIGVIIADSRTMPLRLGTVGCALATYGFEPIIDERGKKDLFGREMHITVRALADQIATAAELVMGETNEKIPFVIVRGIVTKRISDEDERDINQLIKPENCMFLGPLLPKKVLKKLKKLRYR